MTTGVGAELSVAEAWLDARLKASAGLTAVVDTRVYSEVGPTDVAYPFVTYSHQDSTDLVLVGHARVWTDTLYLVRVVAKALTPTLNMITAAAEIDAALTTPVGSAVLEPTGKVLTAVRERPHRMRSVEQGHTYSFIGGFYRIYAQGS